VEPGEAGVGPGGGLGVTLGGDPGAAQGALGERAAVQPGEGQGVELGGVQKAGPSGDQEVAQGGTEAGAEPLQGSPRRDLRRLLLDQNLPPREGPPSPAFQPHRA